MKATTLTYDSLGRVTSSTDGARHLESATIYPLNTPSGTTTTMEVGVQADLVSTLLTVAADGFETSRYSTIEGGPEVLRSGIERDHAKRLTGATLSIGATDLLQGYVYDTKGHLVGQSWEAPGEQVVLDASHTYSGTTGLKTGEDLTLPSVGGGFTADYTYTTSGRLETATLTGATQELYEFYDNGNIRKVKLDSLGTWQDYITFGYDEADHDILKTMDVTGQATTYFGYDSGKRWREEQGPSTNPDSITYAYTGTGRLSTYAREAEAAEPAVSAAYTYDAAGQRTTSTVTIDGVVTTTDFIYTGLTLHKLKATRTQGETTESWSLTYLYDEYGKPYAGVYRSPQTSTTPEVFALVTTDRGDVAELLDANGEPFAAYRYDAWGNPLGMGNAGDGMWAQGTTLLSGDLAAEISERQVLRYAGYCYDSESGLYYLSARHYDPGTRQFLSKDLSRNDGEQSAYGYCLGNPIANVDPSGYATVCGSGYGGKEQETSMAEVMAVLDPVEADDPITWQMSPSAENMRQNLWIDLWKLAKDGHDCGSFSNRETFYDGRVVVVVVGNWHAVNDLGFRIEDIEVRVYNANAKIDLGIPERYYAGHEVTVVASSPPLHGPDPIAIADTIRSVFR